MSHRLLQWSKRNASKIVAVAGLGGVGLWFIAGQQVSRW